MNQSDLSSWMLAGSYVVKAQVPHRYQFGMSYSLQRYEGGNTAALDGGGRHGAQRRLGVRLRRVADLALHLDRLRRQLRALRLPARPRRSSARASRPPFSPSKAWRVRAAAAREVSAPGAEEFIPPTSAEYLPPQRTFSAISNAGIRTQALQNYEFGIERVLNGAALGDARVRSAHRRSNRHGVRLAPRHGVVARPLLRRRRRQRRGARRRRHVHACAGGERARLGGLFVCRRGLDRGLGAGRVRGVEPLGAVGRAIERAHSRRDDVARDRDSVLGHSRGGALQVERRVCGRRQRRLRPGSARGSTSGSRRRCRS